MILKRFLVILFLCIGVLALLAACWVGYVSKLRPPEISFRESDAIRESVYKDQKIDKLLEQNLRMQEALYEAQKQGVQNILNNLQTMQAASNQTVLSVVALLGTSLFFLIAAVLIQPRSLRLHNDSLSQLEALLWEGWVVEKGKTEESGSDEFTVQESAYPVSLCGCSSSGKPVHLCGCKSSALPVNLCKCGCHAINLCKCYQQEGYLEGCRQAPPVHLCGCKK